MWLRHALAIAVRPFTVTVLVPLWIARRNAIAPALASDLPGLGLQLAGLVALVLCGEALLLRSAPHGLWALGFLALNALCIPLVEEAQLERRFGESYRSYCRHVPRVLPRLTPWRPEPPPRG